MKTVGSTDKIEKTRRTKSNVYKLLKDFEASGHDCVRLASYTQKNAVTCAASIRAAIKHYNMTWLNVIRRKDTIYIFREHGYVMQYDC